jgi:uncharacterized membrane protein
MGSQNATLEIQRPAAAGESRIPQGHSINVALPERLISAAAGGLLVAWGVRKRSAAGAAGAIAGAELIYRGLTGHCHVYGALGLDTAGSRKSGAQIEPDAPEVHRAITIGKPPEELYGFWRDPINLAQIVAHFAEVTPRGNGLTHWRVTGRLKQILEWDSRYVEEQPGRKLAWETAPGSTLVNRGDISFHPGPNGAGTEVRLRMQFEPPLGNLGSGLVKALHFIPRGVAGQTLRRFKSLAETGEIPTLKKNPSGRGGSDLF